MGTQESDTTTTVAELKSLVDAFVMEREWCFLLFAIDVQIEVGHLKVQFVPFFCHECDFV